MVFEVDLDPVVRERMAVFNGNRTPSFGLQAVTSPIDFTANNNTLFDEDGLFQEYNK